MEKLQEFQLAFLPDHQRGDVAERRDDAAGVGGHHDDNAAHNDELVAADPDGHHHGAHDERRGQVVDDRAEDKSKPTDQPEKLPIRELPAGELGPHCGEDAPLLHRVHVRDRHHEEQHQLAIVENHMLGGGFERGALIMRGVDEAEKRPDEARRQHDGFRLAQLNDFFDGHESVGDEEDQKRQITDGMPRQVDARCRLHGVERRRSGQEQDQYRNGQHPQPSCKTQHRQPLSTLI